MGTRIGALTPADLPPPPEGRTGFPWTEGTSVPADATAAAWPRITIVTPSYNQGEFLEETIRSVLLQGYPDLEYFVIDGGSADATRDVIARYERFLAGWVSERDRGQTHAINKGFERATGDVHAYLNSDDCYEPGALFAAARRFRAGAEWVVGRTRCWQEGVGSWPFPTLPGRSFTRWLISCPVGQPASFWSARLHGRAGPFREELRYVMDYEMWLRFRFTLGVEPTWIDETLAMYRLHGDSKTVADSGAFADELTRVVSEVERRLGRRQRLRLWAARRHRRGSILGRRGVTRIRDGRYGAGALDIARALATWPPLPFGPALLLGVRGLVGEPPRDSPFPEMWPI